jgi:2-oxoglutarate ferredoxin oxidoreductase subunit alpha
VDYTIKIGGEAGQGLQTIGYILSKVLVRGGYHVYANQDYESRIRGGHNFFQIRFSDKKVLSPSNSVDVLVALDRAGIEEHKGELTKDGMVLYDSESLRVRYEEPFFLDVPLQALAVNAGGKVMMNTVAVGAVLGMLNHDFLILENILSETFKKKGAEVVENNIKAGRTGYEYARENCKRCAFVLSKGDGKKRILISGNEALALGAISAGCKFISAYPMTPSTGIITYMASKADEFSIVAEQAEDEIAAINMALGASFAGVRAMTATSGGGFCLMTEGVSLAGMTETPIVIVLAQRPGPATGLPTRTEQGELFFALFSGHGEFPRAIFAPRDAEDAFYTLQKAFNIAEKYQTVVFVMSDQHLADSYWSVDELDTERVGIVRGVIDDEDVDKDYRRHKITETGISPRAIPGQAGRAVVVTDSDEHGEEGHIIEDARTRKAMVEKRMRKLEDIASEISMPALYGDKKPDILLIGWGPTHGAIKETVDILKEKGIDVSMLHFNEIWPFPHEVRGIIESAGKALTVENNFTAQLRRLIRMETGINLSDSITKYDGRPFTAGEIVRRVLGANTE